MFMGVNPWPALAGFFHSQLIHSIAELFAIRSRNTDSTIKLF